MKKCIRCKIEKELSAFYAHKKMADGHLNKCKECTKKDSSNRFNNLKNIEEWHEKEKERNREKYYRLGYKEKYKNKGSAKLLSQYRKRYPEKYKARNASHGIIKKKGENFHHWSYKNENYKSGFIINYKEHALIHRYLKYDKENFYYKTKEGFPLDTIEKHESYIKLITKKFKRYEAD